MSTLAAIGLLVVGLVATAGVANALRPVSVWYLWLASWATAWVTIELAPHLIVLSGLVAGGLVALGALENPVGIAGLALLVVADAVGIVLAWWAQRSTVITRQAIEELDPDPETPRYPRSHIVFPWLMLRRRGVEVRRGVVYARDGSFPLKLDIYAPADREAEPLPGIVQVHGGGWVGGTRKEQGIPLLGHLAVNGWVGFNINYRLSPYATAPDHVVDVKRAIAWVREHAEELGVDPSFVGLTGGSAGGHLCALAALTAADRSLQPGFEDADVAVQAAVPFYGVYDMLDEAGMHHPLLHWILERYVFKAWRADHPERFRAYSPTHRVTEDAPPFFVIHGDRDHLIPVEDARAFVERLRETSREPVLYAEMRGGQHAFDIIPSFRTVAVVEAIERFLHAMRARGSRSARESEREVAEAVS